MLVCPCDVKPINSSWTVHHNFPAGDVIRPAALSTLWPASKKKKKQERGQSLVFMFFK